MYRALSCITDPGVFCSHWPVDGRWTLAYWIRTSYIKESWKYLGDSIEGPHSYCLLFVMLWSKMLLLWETDFMAGRQLACKDRLASLRASFQPLPAFAPPPAELPALCLQFCVPVMWPGRYIIPDTTLGGREHVTCSAWSCCISCSNYLQTHSILFFSVLLQYLYALLDPQQHHFNWVTLRVGRCRGGGDTETGHFTSPYQAHCLWALEREKADRTAFCLQILSFCPSSQGYSHCRWIWLALSLSHLC